MASDLYAAQLLHTGRKTRWMSIFIPPTDGEIENGLYFCLSWIQRTFTGVTGPHNHMWAASNQHWPYLMDHPLKAILTPPELKSNPNPSDEMGHILKLHYCAGRAQWAEPDWPSAGGFPPLEPAVAQSFLLLKRDLPATVARLRSDSDFLWSA